VSPSPRQALRRLGDRLLGTEFDRAIARAAREPRDGVLVFWNRGLGDVVLALVPLFERIRQRVPGARITVLTRAELDEPFRLAGADEIRVIPGLERNARITVQEVGAAIGREPERFGAVLLELDPTRWLRGERDRFPPRLRWNEAWDALATAAVPEAPGRRLIGAHVSAETGGYYSYVKDWPAERWCELVRRFAGDDAVRWVLFGHRREPPLDLPNVTDLRGRTGFLEIMAIVKNRCRALVGPDSGILNTAYYVDAASPLVLVSLWSDPRQGILRQGSPSPNPLLVHVPIVGRDEDVRNIGVDEVEHALRHALQRGPGP
jgi:ADP-heptose:LPS heptosyltransferase